MLLVAPLLEVSLFASKKAANLVNSLRISHSAQPNSSLVAHPFAVTKLSSRAQLSRIMGARAETKTLQTSSRHRIHRNLDRIALNLRLLERKERRLGAIQPWRSGLSDYLITHWTRQPWLHRSGSGRRGRFRIGPRSDRVFWALWMDRRRRRRLPGWVRPGRSESVRRVTGEGVQGGTAIEGP